jgi:hypothetical protein
MASSLKKHRGPREPAGPAVGVASVRTLQEDGPGTLCPVPPDAGLLLLPEGASPIVAEPDEVLVADPRGSLTPAQRVEQLLVARLHTGHPGLMLQAACRPQDIRRLPR